MARWLLLLGLAVAGCSGPESNPTPAPEPIPAADPDLDPDLEPDLEPEPDPEPDPGPEPIVAPPITRECTVPTRGLAPRVLERVVYSRVAGNALALDLALPADGGPHPVILVFHGGGWSAGERAHVRDDIGQLAAIGYAAAAVDYRLVDGATNRFPAQVADARCAVRYLRSHAAELDLDPERIGGLGYSAGGHLVQMLATAPDVHGLDECADTETSPAVRAVLAFFAPADLRPDATYSRAADAVITRFLGGNRRRQPELAALASPLAHVDGADAAMFLAHGSADGVVPVEHSRAMRAALASVGVPVTLVEVQGGPHGFRLFSQRSRDRAASCTGLAFLQAAFGAP